MNKKVIKAVKKIQDTVDIETKIGLILGSGLGTLVDEFKDTVAIKYEDIPHFPVSSVEGHKGELVAGRLSEVHVLAFAGRIHYYEGYAMQEVCFPVKVLAGLGVTTLIVTNAAGAINASYSPGEVILIKDHINLVVIIIQAKAGYRHIIVQDQM